MKRRKKKPIPMIRLGNEIKLGGRLLEVGYINTCQMADGTLEVSWTAFEKNE